MNQTEYTQPCMVAFACGVSAVLAEQGVKPAYVAGLSLGEYSALEAAGVFTAKQAIELAAYRGKAMADAASGSTGSPLQNAVSRHPRWAVCRSATTIARASWSLAAKRPQWTRLQSLQSRPVPAGVSRSR